MVQYGPLPRRTPWTGRSPSAFVDSNVIYEFTTAEDISSAVDLKVKFGVIRTLEERRLRSQGTLWMAIALDHIQGATLGLEDESMPLVMRRMIDDDREAWLTLALQFVRPEICPEWTLLNLDARVGKNGYNDTIIAEDAARRGIPVITRDDGVVRKTEARGGVAVSPEAFADHIISLAVARQRFFQRWDERAPAWVIRSTPDGSVDSRVARSQAARLRYSRIRFEWIWAESSRGFTLHTGHSAVDM